MKCTTGDLLLIEEGIICHQVNNVGAMGAGIALKLRTKWPIVFNRYSELCQDEKNKEHLLGRIQIVPVDKELYVANVFAQTLTREKRRDTSYDYADLAFERLAIEAHKYDLPVYIPKFMGCGLGGGNWNIYRAIIFSHIPSAIIVIYDAGIKPVLEFSDPDVDIF